LPFFIGLIIYFYVYLTLLLVFFCFCFLEINKSLAGELNILRISPENMIERKTVRIDKKAHCNKQGNEGSSCGELNNGESRWICNLENHSVVAFPHHSVAVQHNLRVAENRVNSLFSVSLYDIRGNKGGK